MFLCLVKTILKKTGKKCNFFHLDIFVLRMIIFSLVMYIIDNIILCLVHCYKNKKIRIYQA